MTFHSSMFSSPDSLTEGAAVQPSTACGFAPGGAFLPWMMSSSLATRFMAAAAFDMSVYVRPARRDIKCRAGAACALSSCLAHLRARCIAINQRKLKLQLLPPPPPLPHSVSVTPVQHRFPL